MAQETINIGTSPNDKTGESIRSALAKIGRMFTELYAKFTNLSKSDVGLGNVDNTADADKPVSTAQAAAITAAVNALIDGAPGALNTLNELAAALADDAAFSTTVVNALASINAKIEAVSIAYTNVIPLNKDVTVIAGKTLTTNEVITIATDPAPVEKGSAKLDLIGNGSAVPDISAFVDVTGAYDSTLNTVNRLFMYHLGGNDYIVISQPTAV